MSAVADVSLCMIVRNEEAVLARCLESVRGHVQEICIVDTGSTDRTVEIAKSFGARVEAFLGNDSFLTDSKEECAALGAPPPYSGLTVLADFARARNQSFVMATQPFVMWLDADDAVVRPDGIAETARELLARRGNWVDIAYHTEVTAEGVPLQTIWRARMIRRGAASWEGKVHEILPVVGERLNHFTVVQKRPVRASAVLHRNLKVMLREYQRGARSARLFFYLGHAHMETANAADAEWAPRLRLRAREFLEKYLECGTWGAERAKAHRLLGDLYIREGTTQAAGTPQVRRAYGRALREYAASIIEMPENPDGYLGCARANYYLERWAECARCTEAALKLGDPYTPPWCDSTERTGWSHIYYNVALSHLKRVDEAMASCLAGLKIFPDQQWLKNNLKTLQYWKAAHP